MKERKPLPLERIVSKLKLSKNVMKFQTEYDALEFFEKELGGLVKDESLMINHAWNYLYNSPESVSEKLAEEKKAESLEIYPSDIILKANADAERISKSENIVSEVRNHLNNIIAGESDNKLLIFILLLSGLMTDPKRKQIILLKGGSGGGKSTLMEIADLFNTKDVGRFTEHALDYSNLEGVSILRLKEFGNMDDDKQGTSTIKFLSSDDKGYVVEYVIRDEDGRFTTEQKIIPPITLITSTTRVSLDEQFERRAWIISPDESWNQTKAIQKFKAKLDWEENLKKLEKIIVTSKEYSKLVLKFLVERLSDADVILLYPTNLSKILRSKRLRVRGDITKMFSLMYVYSFFKQNQLPSTKHNGRFKVFPLPSTLNEVLNIAANPMIVMTAGIDERVRKAVEQISAAGLKKGEIINKDTRERIASALGTSERTVRRYLYKLEIEGYVAAGKEGKQHETMHRLLFNPEDIAGDDSSFHDKNSGKLKKVMDKLNLSSFCPSQTMCRVSLEAHQRSLSLDKVTPVVWYKKIYEDMRELVASCQDLNKNNKNNIYIPGPPSMSSENLSRTIRQVKLIAAMAGKRQGKIDLSKSKPPNIRKESLHGDNFRPPKTIDEFI